MDALRNAGAAVARMFGGRTEGNRAGQANGREYQTLDGLDNNVVETHVTPVRQNISNATALPRVIAGVVARYAMDQMEVQGLRLMRALHINQPANTQEGSRALVRVHNSGNGNTQAQTPLSKLFEE